MAPKINANVTETIMLIYAIDNNCVIGRKKVKVRPIVSVSHMHATFWLGGIER